MKRGAGPVVGPTMKIGELAAKSGVPRETIHYYLREGLLPKPQKGGRTVAYYTAAHLERLLLVRRLREERYLPLAVIRRLLDAPLSADDRDLDALAEVFEILPAPEPRGGAPSEAAAREAERRGLLGPGPRGAEDAERRVLEIVDEALVLGPRARDLTLADLSVCARDLTGMVASEAALFFDDVLAGGDVNASIAALRGGRRHVARFIAAYRDLAMRRVVEEVIDAIRRGRDAVGRTAWISLSDERARQLGALDRRRDLAASTAAEAPAALVRHLFACGDASAMAAVATSDLPPREAAMVTWASHVSGGKNADFRAVGAAARASGSALAELLFHELRLARAVRGRGAGESFLEEGVAALQGVLATDPERERDVYGRVFANFLRGRLEIALPPILGRGAGGVASIERALALAAHLEPVAASRLALNGRLALARHHADVGDLEGARALHASAVAIDPAGPVSELPLPAGKREAEPPRRQGD